MKLLHKVGAIVSLVFLAVGLFWLTRPGMFATGQILCILGLSSAISLSFGLYIFHLRDRIAALEKASRECK
jgi:hypothetical protein